MRVFGHPLHPILVAFPLALLSLAPLCDVAVWFGIAKRLAPVGYYLELLGLVGGGLAALTGFLDFYRLDAAAGSAVGRTALAHASGALATLALFGIAFALRGDVAATPPGGVIALEALGAGVITVTGWLGGHLVFGFGVGVAKSAPELPGAPR